MKKLLFVIFLALVVGLAGIAGYAYLNADSLLARLRPELERIATQTMKTPVKFGDLHLGIGLKPTVAIDGVTVGDSGDSRAISVKSVLLSLDLVPLLSKELKITELKIEQPRITAVKADGVVKIIGLPENAPADAQTEGGSRAPTTRQQTQPGELPIGFALEKFLLTDGSVTFEDKTPNSALPRLEIQDLSVSSELTIADNQLRLGNATVSTNINKSLPIVINVGQITYNLRSTDATLERIVVSVLESQASLNGAINVSDMKGKLALHSDGFDLSKLSPLHTILPALKQFPLSGFVAPDINISLASKSAWDIKGTVGLKEVGATVNNFVLSNLNGPLHLSAVPLEQQAKAEDLTFSFQGSPMKMGFEAGLKNSVASLNKLDLSAFSGTVTAQAETTTTLPQLFKTSATVSSISIDQALAAMSAHKESPLSGTIQSVNLNLNGELGARLKEATGGRITLKIQDALLKQVNIAHEAFKGILTLPLIGDKIMAAVPEEFRGELTAADTKIRYIAGSLNGANGSFSTNDFVLMGSFFSIRGTGSVSMTGAVDLKTAISFNDRFSALLVERVKELRAALDRNGELTFPLAISGTAPALRVVPDTNALVKLGAEAAVRDGAQRLLEGALKGKSGNNGEPIKGIGKLLGF